MAELPSKVQAPSVVTETIKYQHAFWIGHLYGSSLIERYTHPKAGQYLFLLAALCWFPILPSPAPLVEAQQVHGV